MPRTAERIELKEKEKEELTRIERSGKSEARKVQRARIILACAEGLKNKEVAAKLPVGVLSVAKWRKRYAADGISGLEDAPRSGKPPVIEYKELRKSLLNKLSESPPKGYRKWDGKILSEELGISKDRIWRALRKERICLSRKRSWCISTDPEFASNSADIIGLYLEPPENALVLSIDEKPQMQAVSRKTGYVRLRDGKIVKALQSTYKRNGTLNLFAALNTITGTLKAKTTERKTRQDFLGFMEEVVADAPAETEIHVILDNYCIHKRCDEWLKLHANVSFHYTPISASWLNQVEIFFGIMTKKILRGVSYENVKCLANAIQDYIDKYNETAIPFQWRKREVRGSQISNNIANLCN